MAKSVFCIIYWQAIKPANDKEGKEGVGVFHVVAMPDTSRARDLCGRWLLLLSLEVLYFIANGIKQAIQSLAALLQIDQQSRVRTLAVGAKTLSLLVK